ncbi:7909_t:CDS:2 [Ambispora leptoticha]|uniref:7909_t:CDS:1 n=1 Tax=Ambispora leptoticha TaxID=144679 RepID=A0A9N8ZBP5_9GLOM|nr:7909_t:CDS:2 [Ambispora leptoticha]
MTEDLQARSALTKTKWERVGCCPQAKHKRLLYLGIQLHVCLQALQ